MADRSVSASDAASLLAGEPLAAVAPDATLLAASFDGEVPEGWDVQGATSATRAEGGRVGPERWLVATTENDIAREIDESGELTIVLVASSATPDQVGPARVFTISPNPFERNVTIGQDGGDLIVRVRSPFTGPNAASPELAVPGVFADSRPRTIVIRHDASAVHVSVDDPDGTSTLEFFPATAPLIDAFIDDVVRLRFSSSGEILRDISLAAWTFAAWAACVGVLCGGMRRPVLAALLLGPIVAVELVHLAVLPNYSGDATWIIAAVTVTVAVFLVTRWTMADRDLRVSPTDGPVSVAG